MWDIVVSRFDAEPPGSLARGRLLAASEGTPLFSELKARELELERRNRLREVSAQAQLIFINNNTGSVTVTKGNTLNIAGNVQAQNIVAGDMVGSANQAVQNMTAQQASDREVLLAVMKFIERAALDAGQRDAISAAVAVAAQKPDTENRGRLLGILKGLVGGAATTATIGGGYAEIIDLVSKWVG
jgi:hypothetical protein